MSMGAHGVLLDAENRVLLVRHTYKEGWYFPGGAVKKGETVHDAVRREVYEETCLSARVTPADLFGIFYSVYDHRHNYVVLFVIREWERAPEGTRRSLEIADARFFPVDELPEGVSPSVRDRLREVLNSRPISEHW